jgi:hypothetical protein
MMEIAPLHFVALRDSHIPTAPLLLPLSGKETERSPAGRHDGAPTDQQSEDPDPVFLIVVSRYF